jgi:hypothetical protein
VILTALLLVVGFRIKYFSYGCKTIRREEFLSLLAACYYGGKTCKARFLYLCIVADTVIASMMLPIRGSLSPDSVVVDISHNRSFASPSSSLLVRLPLLKLVYDNHRKEVVVIKDHSESSTMAT